MVCWLSFSLSVAHLIYIWDPNLVITMPADDLAPDGARSSAGIVLTEYLDTFFFLVNNDSNIFVPTVSLKSFYISWPDQVIPGDMILTLRMFRHHLETICTWFTDNICYVMPVDIFVVFHYHPIIPGSWIMMMDNYDGSVHSGCQWRGIHYPPVFNCENDWHVFITWPGDLDILTSDENCQLFNISDLNTMDGFLLTKFCRYFRIHCVKRKLLYFDFTEVC